MIEKLLHIPPSRIELNIVERSPLAAAYTEARDAHWNQAVQNAQRNGGKLWNGSVYTIQTVTMADDEAKLTLSTCEYKDIVFKIAIGVDQILTQFGPSSLFEHIAVVCLPITTDGKIIAGLRPQPTGAEILPTLDFIGGNLNADEMTVQEYAGFKQFMLRELEEEVGIRGDQEKSRLTAVLYYQGKYDFVYTLELPIASTDIPEPLDNEFAKLVAFTPQEILSTAHPIDPTVSQCKPLLMQLR